MKSIGIIPARYGSTRFPGKPLADINGKTMIRRVYEQAHKCTALSGVFVATDDQRIVDEVMSFGGNVIMTGTHHESGTERCYEALKTLGVEKYDVVVNIQGDEPYIHPEQIEKVVNCFNDSEVQIATLGHYLSNPYELNNPNIVKIARNIHNNALYFSRSPIPYLRSTKPYSHVKHIGIYAFLSTVVEQIVKLPPSSLEMAESLEQLRWLENGYSIRVEITDMESIPVDTPEDVQKFK